MFKKRLLSAFILSLLAVSLAFSGQSDTPVRPVKGGIVLDFNKNVSWSTKPHNGINYQTLLNEPVISVGAGAVHQFTKNLSPLFGSINPNGKGPAIWVKYTLSDGSPIYVLYGNVASYWTDKSASDTQGKFAFNCNYTITLKAGDLVNPGDVIGYGAPIYNDGYAAHYIHIGVFKPNLKDKNNNVYYNPPADGWIFSDINMTEGSFINPEDFFTKYGLNNNSSTTNTNTQNNQTNKAGDLTTPSPSPKKSVIVTYSEATSSPTPAPSPEKSVVATQKDVKQAVATDSNYTWTERLYQ